MINLNYSQTGDIRGFFNNCRKTINLAILAFALLSVVYFIYWCAVETSDIVFEYTGHILSPLANFLYPNGQDYMAFRDTSFFFMTGIFPLFLLYYICDKAEEYILKAVGIKHTVETKKEIKREVKAQNKHFDLIDRYSICLSLDYEGSPVLNKQIKEMLNKAIYSKLRKALATVNCNISTASNEAMIVVSADFECYDEVYGKMILALARIKKAIEAQHNIDIVPSLTTDAYSGEITLDEIKRRHKDITTLIKKNRATSTAMFQNKYRHLKRNKYTGVPIGEYTSPNAYSKQSYELNMIYKNLSDTLAGLS